MNHRIRNDGYDITFEDFGDSNSLVLATSTGKCDIGGSSVSITEERKKSVYFSPVYYQNRVVAINKANHYQYQTPEDFDGELMGTLTGTNSAKVAESAIPNFRHQDYNNLADGCLAVSQQKIS